MGPGPVVFALVFLALPLLGLAGVAALPQLGLGVALFSLILLATGFSIAFAFVDW